MNENMRKIVERLESMHLQHRRNGVKCLSTWMLMNLVAVFPTYSDADAR